MKIKYIVYILLILGISALVAFRIIKNSEQGNAEPMKSDTAITVSGMVVKPQKFEDYLSLSGSLEANEQIDLHCEISGVVESINFEEGQKVKKGQVLFSVNDIELRAQLSQTQTAQKLAAENERRAKLLLDKQAISQQEYEITNADFQSSQAQAQLMAAQLSKTNVTAPFSGTIGLRAISKGTYVTPLTTIAKLVNTDRLKITFAIPEKYASQISIGNSLTFTISGSEEEHKAKIYAIEPEIELATRTLRMRAIAENSDGKLYPGMFSSIKLPLEIVPDALLVPSEALIPIQNGKMIFISDGGNAKEMVVSTGARTADSVRVLSGLKAGDTILTYGVMALKNGTPVKVKLQGEGQKDSAK
ncbi:hypothetical protein LCGC14_1047030 [marine sediment metagenome]|uniref:Efflux RND transporter periplasmic adaptor subunit n=2 Tax=root TaxID=1 RepID=A0A831QM45_9FLAO|nr:efflux RND transporter periplasmic adaptor subunit [Pricia antarctica]